MAKSDLCLRASAAVRPAWCLWLGSAPAFSSMTRLSIFFGTGAALRPLIQSASPATAVLGIAGLVVGASVLGACAAIGAAHMLEFGAKSSGHDTFGAKAQ